VSDIYRVACAAGFSGDRLGVAKPLVNALIQYGGPACLIFESLAERTLALAQLERRQNDQLGYEPLLKEMLEPVLCDCVQVDIPIVGNFGAANPFAAAAVIARLAKEKNLPELKIAVVTGDDISGAVHRNTIEKHLARSDQELLAHRQLISANVYLGAKEIADALTAGAQVVVTGRVADPALTVGPLMAHFKKSWGDWDFLASATMAGHLLECGAQVTGGYFADPGYKDVPNLGNVGFPIVEFDSQGNICVTKPEGTGGVVNRLTVTEQLLYELHDPASYLTPDVIADITQATIRDLGNNRVELTGIKGHPKPDSLKANIGIDGGWLAEAEISYAGHHALERAQLAAQIIRDRIGRDLSLRVDFIGSSSVFMSDSGEGPVANPSKSFEDIRLRVAAAHQDQQLAMRVCREVTALYTCGPAGGGGVRTCLKPRLNTLVALIPRAEIKPSYAFYKEEHSK
jgi:Acyclic terpene utilisation family protein AtuA